MKTFRPMLFDSLKNYSKSMLAKDIVSGIIVAIIALPLSIALALASGVGPEEGLYTAIVAGFLISFFGGSPVQIAGPTAAFATIVAGIVVENGIEGLAVATVMAGLLLIIMGICRFGSLIRFIPYTITTGFTAGIAVTIAVGQIKDFAGLTYPKGTVTIETTEKIAAIARNIGTINSWAVIVGLCCLAVLIIWPYINKVIPGSLIAVIVGIVMVKFLKLPVNTIGDLYSVSSRLPSLSVPAFDMEMIKKMLPDACTIAVLAAIESLLSCVVADGMVGSKHRSDTELIAQGIGNIGSALFGGIPATGAIARTAANIKSGGRTPVAGMVHAVTLVLILVILMPYAAWIPMPTIAAILFIVAYNMCQWRPFKKLIKTAPVEDIIVLVMTFVLTVVFDLVVAIGFGMLMACLLFIKQMSKHTDTKAWIYREDAPESEAELLIDIPRSVKVVEITGPLFFGAASVLSNINIENETKVLILRMRSVLDIDITSMNALEALHEKCMKNGVRLILSHVNERPSKVMDKAGFTEKLGCENIKANIVEALEAAEI